GLQIPDRTTANDSATYRTLITARGIFIEGGDQWPYVNYWKGSLVEDAIHYVFQHGGVIGGTSAGLAVLGEFVFDAQYGSLYPEQAAYNPYHYRVSITDDFLEILPDVFTDSHFHTRARMARLVPMMARRIQDHGDDNIMGIGLDDNTAFCILPDRTGTAYGEGTVTILHKSPGSQISAEAGTPVVFTDIVYNQLIHGAVFDIQTRQLVNTGPYIQSAGTPPASGSILDTTLNGSLESTAQIGEVVITNLTTDPLNAWRGRLGQSPGLAVVPNSIIMPKLWNNIDLSENRFIGGMYGIATHNHFAAIYIDDNSSHRVSSSGIITADRLMYILDGYGMTHYGFNTSLNTNYPAIIGAKLHFLNTAVQYDLTAHGAVVALEHLSGKAGTGKFGLLNNYPNPFNAVTQIEFELPESTPASVEIFSVTGQLVAVVADDNFKQGFYQVTWDARNHPSGIYFIRLSTPDFSNTRQCLLLR
ncbi:MAG: T9SS C-terminal target domain-containing protein, partial [Calditrichaeota bacterium]